MNKLQNQDVSTFPQPWNASVSPSWPFYRPKCQISLPFHILQVVKSLPFYIFETWKRYPFQVKPHRISRYREYPPPPGVRERILVVFSPSPDPSLVRLLFLQSTPDNSNLQGKSKKVLVIRSSDKIAGSKKKAVFTKQWTCFNHIYV